MRRRVWTWTTELEVQWLADRSYWLGFRSGVVVALLAVIVVGLVYLVAAR